MYNKYFNTIINENDSYSKQIYSLLSARGFLLDYKQDHIIISNNSFDSSERTENSFPIYCESKSDKEELKQIFEEYSLGYILGDKLILNEEEKDISEIFDKLFISNDKRRISVCGETDHHNHSWGRDFNVTPPKYPTMDLDPFIARYTKSFSSAGVWITYSCQGHSSNQKPARIYFNGRYNGLWHKLIVEEFLALRNSVIAWNYYNNYTKVKHHFSENFYIQALISANYIYDNRILLRDIKTYIISELKGCEKNNKSADDVYGMMLNSYNNYFEQDKYKV